MSLAPEVIVLLSGGADSSACLHFVQEINRPACALFVDYGQAAVKEESRASQLVAEWYGVPLIQRSLTNAYSKKAGLIACRNAFLLSTAAMESTDTIRVVAIGVHSGTDYQDCSAEFVSSMNSIIQGATSGRMSIMAPFIEWSKGDVWQYCLEKHVPLDLTYSCEIGGIVPCGKCLSCLDREALHAQA